MKSTWKLLTGIFALIILASVVVAPPSIFTEGVNVQADSSTIGQQMLERRDALTAIYTDALISSLQCQDTDSQSLMDFGKVYPAKGTSSGAYAGLETQGSWEDYCRNDNELVEYFCGGGQSKVKFNKVMCLAGCSNGACNGYPYCFDKDGGINAKVKGNVFLITSGVSEFTPGLTPAQDSCVDSNTLLENYCDIVSNGIATTEIPCEFGCAGGKCKKQAGGTQAGDDATAITESTIPGSGTTITESTLPESSTTITESATPGLGATSSQTSSGAISIRPGRAVTIQGISVSVNTGLTTLTFTETNKFYLGQNQIDGISFMLLAAVPRTARAVTPRSPSRLGGR